MAAAQTAVPVVNAKTLSDPFAGETLASLAALLPRFVSTRRWYRAKARGIERLTIKDSIPIPQADSIVLISRIEFADGGLDDYLIPLCAMPENDHKLFEPRPDDVLARLTTPARETALVFEAIWNPVFCNELLSVTAKKSHLQGRRGQLIASHTVAFNRASNDFRLPLKAFVSRAEQSNSSIIFEQKLIMKLFRKVESGINPDIVIGEFLTEREFPYVPAVFGTIEYRPSKGDREYAALLQAFVPNRGDAWKYTLESLDDYFKRLAGPNRYRDSLRPSSFHPLRLMGQPMPSVVHDLLGNYLDSARLLGKRTAQMHRALSAEAISSDFVPEGFTPAHGEKLYEEMMTQADAVFDVLRRKQTDLTGAIAESARTVLDREAEIRDRFDPLRHFPIRTSRIRHHGDFHLGQVLYTGDDFVIIDFEGEPARPIEERRQKALALRDVAGMIRSFQYAAYSTLFKHLPASNFSSGIEADADSWAAWISAAYLDSYFAEASGLESVPLDPGERQVLLDAFLLQKALYEIGYELNNRPDWVQIPLRGILSLLN